jgi:hypothetical protein
MKAKINLKRPEFEIDLRTFKSNFSKYFPNSVLSIILLSEPDEMSLDELIGKLGTWLILLDQEKDSLFISSIRNNKEEHYGRN